MITKINSKIETKSSWVEIDLGAIRQNIRTVQNFVGKHVKLMPVIKVEGYGHGLVETAKICQEEGVNALGVANIQEGLKLRQSGIKGLILVLYDVPIGQVKEIIQWDLSVSLYDIKVAVALDNEAKRQGKRAKIHIPLDTGMGWYGLDEKEVIAFIDGMRDLKHIEFEGIYSHLSQASQKTFTQRQINTFKNIVNQLETTGISFHYKHMAKSSGILGYKESHLDFVRPGITIYGLNPTREEQGLELVSALSFKTRVMQVRNISKGSPISYDGTFITQRDSQIAILPVGFTNGLNRSLSNKGEVIIRGKKSPIVGAICMNIAMIDVTDNPGVEQGDEVTVLGKQGTTEITAENIAMLAGTNVYDVLTNIGTSNERFYID